MEAPVDGQVVLHFRDGVTDHCRLAAEFSPHDLEVEVESDDHRRRRVRVDDLKAVFFLKDPRQRQMDLERDGSDTANDGAAVARVEFFDGEIIRGHVSHYSVENTGFWLYPSAPESNNARIFVVARSLQTVSLEG
jgi:hypothetical protein